MPRRSSPFPVPARPTVRRPWQWPNPRPPSAPIHLYSGSFDNLPIPNGQAQGVISSAGTATLQVGPTGLGTVWYPASAVISTTAGILDTSACNIYVGPAGFPTTLQGTLFPGGAGVLALAIPAMSPGLYVLAVWSGGTPGNTCSLNVTGTMRALARSS